jgi:Ca-activated chloride channel family protein
MIELTYPWFLLALPLPLVVYFLLAAYKETKNSIKVPFFQRLVSITGEIPSTGSVVLKRTYLQRFWLVISWILIVFALSKPMFVGAPVVIEKSGRDLMVAVDLSGSMEAKDFVDQSGQSIDRLAAVKQVLAEFVTQRERDRLGLIVFGDAPFIQTPFTEDHTAWLALLDETSIGMAGQSTAFGDAIGLSIKTFSTSAATEKVLLALTDGNDTGSKVPPVDAAKVAKEYGITIYTIAVGDPSTAGEEALDIETLERVSELTDGGFYQAYDREQLEKIYQRINELEPQVFESLSYRPKRSLHHYLLAAVVSGYVLLFSVLSFLASRTSRKSANV